MPELCAFDGACLLRVIVEAPLAGFGHYLDVIWPVSSSSQGSTATNLAPIFNITREKSSSGKAESHFYPSVHLLLLWLDRKIPCYGGLSSLKWVWETELTALLAQSVASEDGGLAILQLSS